MKLVVICLFAVCCFSLAKTSPRPTENRKLQRLKLNEALRQLKSVKVSLQHSDKMLNTPPENIEDCCCRSALECFRSNLQVHFNVEETNQKLLYNSLRNPVTERGLESLCSSGNVNSTCQDCVSHPKKNASEFFNRLESLIQMAISRLV